MILLIIYVSGVIVAWGLLGGALYSKEKACWPKTSINNPYKCFVSMLMDDIFEGLLAIVILIFLSWLSATLVVIARLDDGVGGFGKYLLKFWWKSRPDGRTDQVYKR